MKKFPATLCLSFLFEKLQILVTFLPEIATFSTLTLFKFQLCKFGQVLSSYLISGHVKVQNVCRNYLLLSVCHFLFEKSQFLARNCNFFSFDLQQNPIVQVCASFFLLPYYKICLGTK
jgi:hypothetical protein